MAQGSVGALGTAVLDDLRSLSRDQWIALTTTVLLFAIVLGFLVGQVAGLIVAILVGYALDKILRKRNRLSAETGKKKTGLVWRLTWLGICALIVLFRLDQSSGGPSRAILAGTIVGRAQACGADPERVTRAGTEAQRMFLDLESMFVNQGLHVPDDVLNMTHLEANIFEQTVANQRSGQITNCSDYLYPDALIGGIRQAELRRSRAYFAQYTSKQSN